MPYNDTTSPTATISLSDSALKSRETATVTIQFSESVSWIDLTNLRAENGSLSGLTRITSNTWTAVFTPTANITDASNRISLNHYYKDSAGNTGLSASSGVYRVDTKAPTATISLSDHYLKIGETATVTIQFSEAVKGFDLRDLSADNGALSNLTDNGNNTYTAIFTPIADITKINNKIRVDGAYTDIAGNLSSGMAGSYCNIDTTSPTAIISLSDHALKIGETATVSIQFSEAVKGFDLKDLHSDNGSLSRLLYNGNNTWTAVFKSTANINDTSNSIHLNVNGYTDNAGNYGQADSENVSVHTVAQTVELTGVTGQPNDVVYDFSF